MNNGTITPMRALPTLLAFAATVTAACLSILAGWQRGGLLAERALLVCVGVVLVVAAHLLPALCRPHGWRIRMLGIVLWVCCMTATCYGHAVFFVMAQKHAGEARAAVVPLVPVPGRNLAEIASDRVGVIARLARVIERKCGERCAAVRIERTTLNARLVALDAEAVEVTRRESALDLATAERATAKAVPLAALSAVFGVPANLIDLAVSMAFAVVIEGVACFCWLLALRAAETPTTTVSQAKDTSHVLSVTPKKRTSTVIAHDGNDAAGRPNSANSKATDQMDDLTLVLTATRNGTLRGTVSEIRRHLRCSQAKAATLRKHVAQQMRSSHATTGE